MILCAFWAWWGLFKAQSPVSQLQLEIKLNVIRCPSLGIVLGCGICLWKDFRVSPSKIPSETSSTYHLVLHVSVATWYGFSQTIMCLSATAPLGKDTGKVGVELWNSDPPKYFETQSNEGYFCALVEWIGTPCQLLGNWVLGKPFAVVMSFLGGNIVKYTEFIFRHPYTTNTHHIFSPF